MNGIAAILLAAGRSRRMGRCKQLLPLGDTTVIGRCLETLRAGGIDRIVTVVSPEGERVAEAARFGRSEVAVNCEPDGDMVSSVRSGRDLLPADVAGVLIALCDCPLVASETVRRLAAAHRTSPDNIIQPVYAGRRGHPLLIPRQVLDGLAPGMTLRDLLRLEPSRVVMIEVNDPGILVDMDTPEDYAAVQRLAGGQNQ